MKGFSQRWKDFPDYILGITKEIWEERGLHTLHETYAEDLPMRFPSGLVRGRKAVIDGTRATLVEFPDRQLLGEDVIWCGDDETGRLSSHRLMTTGTHLGHGFFGPPTGKRFEVRAIADCAARENFIFDEWLCRDTSGIVHQLGMSPLPFTRDLIAREGGPDKAIRPFHPRDDVDGGYNSRGNDHEVGLEYEDLLTRIMAGNELSAIAQRYDRACRTEFPGARRGWSWPYAEQMWMGLRAAFPDATFTIDHRIGREDPMMPPRAALRWSLLGKHEGRGMYGEPTGAEVYVMGFTHAEFGPWGLRREYTVFDEISIWKQILLQTGMADDVNTSGMGETHPSRTGMTYG
ncbi:ester cyclase [Jannaschia aquimarina]|uniref:SnoaL-like polyketide cyclase n=1 Tax=Jannaschia aquimarina TaxID=935700 RepID=A0A0D1EIT0_9RHOB|nr:ester cyclase [Jannaschia aquimarina]KIT17539.1 SnoaL-like polyketide cyclase [Jannaschia aquimarina]SNS73382.1 SnoaL-like polyketide cyclase [Jannaschia aquimarina]